MQFFIWFRDSEIPKVWESIYRQFKIPKFPNGFHLVPKFRNSEIPKFPNFRNFGTK